MSEDLRELSSSQLFRKADKDVRRDVDLLVGSIRLQRIRRYVGQPYWDDESSAARFADILEPYPRLETVAEHSWAVADAVLTVGWRYPYLNIPHACQLAILHDKMEIFIGDMNPLGRDGTGKAAHAFNEAKQVSKEDREREAIAKYLDRVNNQDQAHYGALLIEALECQSPEARLVKALDKMNALAFILLKKGGTVEDKHLRFLIEFTQKNNRYFPPLVEHSNELLRRIFVRCANQRGVSLAKLFAAVAPPRSVQLSLLPEVKKMESPEPIRKETKRDRLSRIFSDVQRFGPSRTGVEAWARLSSSVNRIEDGVWGSYWQPPRFVPPGTRTDRMYPIAPDSIFPVDGWFVDVLVSDAELTFISASGAIEIQEKDRDDLFARDSKFELREARVLFALPDSDDKTVWDERNRRI